MKHFLFLLFALPLVLVSCNPDEDDSELSGCMDPDAVNFSANATVDDGSCVYGESSGCDGASTVTYDGYSYALVAIGDQCWFAENLRTEHYANGNVILGGLSTDEWWDAGENNHGAQTIYNNDAANLIDHGRLYNWSSVSLGLCPAGWHVPTAADYTDLLDYLGGNSGTKMKSSPSDMPSWDGSNESGFSGLAGGSRTAIFGGNTNTGYSFIGEAGYFWSASADFSQPNQAKCLLLSSGADAEVIGATRSKGLSVRCVRD